MRCDSLSRSPLNIWNARDLPAARFLAVLMVWLLVPALNPTWWDAGYWRSGAPAMAFSNAAAPLTDDQIAPWLGHQRSLTQDDSPGHEADLLASVERAFPAVADKLGQRAHFVEAISGNAKGWRPSHEAMAPAGLKPEEQKAWLAMAGRQPSSAAGLDLFFPEIFTRPQEVAADGMRLDVHAVGARSVRGHVVDGRMVYADAWPETDAIYTAGVGHSEEFLCLRNASAPTRFSHTLMAGDGAQRIARVEVQADGSVNIVNVTGQRVRIDKPYVVDALGTRSETAAVWRVERGSDAGSWSLGMEIDATRLVYPLLVDPSWVTVRHMNQSRFHHTATLLPSGKVLVVGGNSNGALASAELYDPATDTWSTTESIANARYYHTATVLSSGKVLVVGGVGNGTLVSAEFYDPATGTWSTTGSLVNPRCRHTATVLPSGKVLVVGGAYNTGTLASAELFDPVTGTWSATGSLAYPRQSHTASVLPSGRVLVVGGADNTGLLASAELFDPADVNGTWKTIGSLANVRYAHTASVLPSGKVLFVGGNPNAPLASAELFDPAGGGSGTWLAAGFLANGRGFHTATVLPSGKVLVVGGEGYGTLASAELFEPAGAGGNSTWSATGSLANARYGHTATVLPSGKVLVVGGHGDGNLASAELFEPADGTWKATGSLANARYFHTASVLPSGKVLVAGGDGDDYGNGNITHSTAELFDPAVGAGTWSVTGSLTNARHFHTATVLPSGKVLVVGGYGKSNLANAELFDPASGTWSATESLANARRSHTASVLPSGMVLIVGGSDSTGNLASAELFDPASGTWKTTRSLASRRYDHTASVLPSGKVLVVGGSSDTGFLASAELFDPTTETWSATGSLANPRYSHTATLLPTGKVLVVGGYGNTNLASAELFDPAAGTWSGTGSLAIARYSHTASVLSSGKVLVVGGYDGNSTFASAELFDPATGAWSATGSLVEPRYDHTATVLPSGKVLVVGGYDNNTLSSAELFSFDIDSTRIPLLSNVIPSDATLTCAGSRFTSTVLSSGQVQAVLSGSGDSTNSSPSNLPCVHLQCLDNDQQWYLNSVGGFTDAATTVAIPSNAVGPCWVRVSVNGIFSSAVYVNIAQPMVTALTTTKVGILDNGDLATLTVHLNRPYFLPVSVDLQTSGVATTPNDFTLAASRLTIPAGALVATTTLTGRNVNRVSGDRNLTVSVTNVTNALNSTPAPFVDLIITSSNHAPTITSGDNALPGIIGGQTSADTPVTKLYFGKIADQDAGDGKGIAVTGVTGSGTWSYTISNGAMWTPITSVSDAAALLLSEAGSTQVRYSALVGHAEVAAITYRAWDRTSRNEGDIVNVTVNGGTTAFSTATSRTTLQVDSQAAPVVTFLSTTASWTEGTAPLQIDGGATCTDADSLTFSGGNITVTMTPNNRVGDRLDYDSVLTGGIVRTAAELRTTDGTLLGTLSGGNDGAPLIIALTAATTPAIAQTMLRGLTYANIGGNPEATPTGTGQRTIVISVDDETAARGTSQAKVVTVQAVDGAPIVEPLTLSLVPGLTVSSQLIARDPEGLGLTFVREGDPTKGDATVDLNSGLITYHNTLLDGQNDSFQVRVSDGLHTTLSTVTVQVTAGNANGLRFTSVAPLVWRSGVVLSYTPTITGTTATVRYSLVPPPQEAKAGMPLIPTTYYHFQTETGTVTIDATLPHPDGNYLRFGILAVDTVNGTSAYQPVLIKFLVAGSG